MYKVQVKSWLYHDLKDFPILLQRKNKSYQ